METVNPDEILSEIRKLAHSFQVAALAVTPTRASEIYATKLADLVIELDDHLSSSGRPPRDWMGDFDI